MRFGALRMELAGLLAAERERLSEAKRQTSLARRVERYTQVVTDCLRRSTLTHIGDRMVYFDGMAYQPIDEKNGDLHAIVVEAELDAGIGVTEIRRMGWIPEMVLKAKSVASDPNLISFSNCVYDLASGMTRPFSPDAVTDYYLPYAWRPDAACPMWDAFLEEVLPDRAERSCLQEFFGMCYVDRRALAVEKMAILVGKGANGKSVIFDVMKKVIGEDRMSYLDPSQLSDARQVSAVAGCRLNFCPDARRGAAFDSCMKALASSNEVQGWELYHGSVVVSCPPLAFALNEMPAFKDVTDAFFRRLLIFPFEVSIPVERQDMRLANRICAHELAGIFNWVMEGRRRLLSMGGRFTPCMLMDEALDSVKAQARSGGRLVPEALSDWLRSNGYLIAPSDGAELVKVLNSDICDGVGTMTPQQVARCMSLFGVAHDRCTKGTRYFLYKKPIKE
jgi:putative DNA primase/helicase